RNPGTRRWNRRYGSRPNKTKPLPAASPARTIHSTIAAKIANFHPPSSMLKRPWHRKACAKLPPGRYQCLPTPGRAPWPPPPPPAPIHPAASAMSAPGLCPPTKAAAPISLPACAHGGHARAHGHGRDRDRGHGHARVRSHAHEDAHVRGVPCPVPRGNNLQDRPPASRDDENEKSAAGRTSLET